MMFAIANEIYLIKGEKHKTESERGQGESDTGCVFISVKISFLFPCLAPFFFPFLLSFFAPVYFYSFS